MNGRMSRAIRRAARQLGAKPKGYVWQAQRNSKGQLTNRMERRHAIGTFKQVCNELKREGILLARNPC